MNELNFSAKEASWISALTFSLFRIPTPLIEILLQVLQVPHFVQLGVAGALIGAGILALGFVESVPGVATASILGIGLGYSLSLLSTYTAAYHFFTDEQIPLFMSIISSGAGLGVAIIALSFDWLRSSFGWKTAFKCQSLLAALYLSAFFILNSKCNPYLPDRRNEDSQSGKKLPQLQTNGDENQVINWEKFTHPGVLHFLMKVN